MDATTLNILRREVKAYGGEGLNGYGYFLQSEDGCVLAVADVYHVRGKRYADSGLIVRIEGDTIIIERDMNDKPLVDALVQAGIPRSQIVLAYAGETVEESVP